MKYGFPTLPPQTNHNTPTQTDNNNTPTQENNLRTRPALKIQRQIPISPHLMMEEATSETLRTQLSTGLI
jgi:hypothetical protein